MDLSEVYTGFHIWKDLDLSSIVAKEGAEGNRAEDTYQSRQL